MLFTSILTYSYKIHGYLGNILKEVLEEDVYQNLIKVLEPYNLYDSSIWPDKVKNTKRYFFTKTLHYMNIDTCNMNEEDLYNNTIYSAIKELTLNNSAGVFKDVERREKTKFLLHFLQDISQPLHSYGKGRGGNSIKIIRNKNGRNKTTNLHTLWDSEIPQTFISSNKYVPYIRNVTLIDVINFNLKISCEYIHNIKEGYIIFEEYYREDIVEEMFNNYINLARIYL